VAVKVVEEPLELVDLAVQVVDKVVEQVKREVVKTGLDQLNKVIQVEMEAAVVEWQVAVVVPHKLEQMQQDLQEVDLVVMEYDYQQTLEIPDKHHQMQQMLYHIKEVVV
tara:strand:- start:316 stop:642 length:327 start_codon:yes stop_codon:yes gene_type:complete